MRREDSLLSWSPWDHPAWEQIPGVGHTFTGSQLLWDPAVASRLSRVTSRGDASTLAQLQGSANYPLSPLAAGSPRVSLGGSTMVRHIFLPNSQTICSPGARGLDWHPECCSPSVWDDFNVFFILCWFSLVDNCRWFRSPVHRCGDWLLRWGMTHRWLSPSVWICPWPMENLIPLRLSTRNSSV